MTINSVQPNKFAVQPRFQGTTAPLNLLESKLYPLADGFLRMPQLAEGVIKRNMLHSKAGSVQKWIGSKLISVAKNVLDHDYKEVVPLPKLGRIVVEPPMGALVALLFGFTLGGRLTHAIHRAVGGDKRELRDIVCRDIPTFTLILFALKPMMAAMSKGLEKFKGIELVQGAKVFGYSELEDIYRVTSTNRLKSILVNPKNHKGVLAAIDRTMENPSLAHNARALLTRFRRAVKSAINLVPEGGKYNQQVLDTIDKPAREAFKVLQQLDANHSKYISRIGKGRCLVNQGFVEKFIRKFKGNVPAFKDMFAAYAKSSRVWANVVAYGMVIGLLGFGVTAFNQWFTEREYKKLMAEKAQTPPNPFQLG